MFNDINVNCDLITPLLLQFLRSVEPHLDFERVALQCNEFIAQVQRYNKAVGLVSRGSVNDLDAHVVDSLSLAPYIGIQGEWLDIGSGAGFPALPLAVLRPARPATLLERSSKKCDFLRMVVRLLDLKHVRVVCGTFPDDAPVFPAASYVTARAVEQPELILEQVARYLPAGGTFLCQSPAGRGFAGIAGIEGLSWRLVQDAWSEVRRGELVLITRA